MGLFGLRDEYVELIFVAAGCLICCPLIICAIYQLVRYCRKKKHHETRVLQVLRNGARTAEEEEMLEDLMKKPDTQGNYYSEYDDEDEAEEKAAQRKKFQQKYPVFEDNTRGGGGQNPFVNPDFYVTLDDYVTGQRKQSGQRRGQQGASVAVGGRGRGVGNNRSAGGGNEKPPVTLNQKQRRQVLINRVTHFYKFYDPAKLPNGNIEKLVTNFFNQNTRMNQAQAEKLFWEALVQKYGQEPYPPPEGYGEREFLQDNATGGKGGIDAFPYNGGVAGEAQAQRRAQEERALLQRNAATRVNADPQAVVRRLLRFYASKNLPAGQAPDEAKLKTIVAKYQAEYGEDFLHPTTQQRVGPTFWVTTLMSHLIAKYGPEPPQPEEEEEEEKKNETDDETKKVFLPFVKSAEDMNEVMYFDASNVVRDEFAARVVRYYTVVVGEVPAKALSNIVNVLLKFFADDPVTQKLLKTPSVMAAIKAGVQQTTSAAGAAAAKKSNSSSSTPPSPQTPLPGTRGQLYRHEQSIMEAVVAKYRKREPPATALLSPTAAQKKKEKEQQELIQQQQQQQNQLHEQNNSNSNNNSNTVAVDETTSIDPAYHFMFQRHDRQIQEQLQHLNEKNLLSSSPSHSSSPSSSSAAAVVDVEDDFGLFSSSSSYSPSGGNGGGGGGGGPALLSNNSNGSFTQLQSANNSMVFGASGTATRQHSSSVIANPPLNMRHRRARYEIEDERREKEEGSEAFDSTTNGGSSAAATTAAISVLNMYDEREANAAAANAAAEDDPYASSPTMSLQRLGIRAPSSTTSGSGALMLNSTEKKRKNFLGDGDLGLGAPDRGRTVSFQQLDAASPLSTRRSPQQQQQFTSFFNDPAQGAATFRSSSDLTRGASRSPSRSSSIQPVHYQQQQHLNPYPQNLYQQRSSPSALLSNQNLGIGRGSR